MHSLTLRRAIFALVGLPAALPLFIILAALMLSHGASAQSTQIYWGAHSAAGNNLSERIANFEALVGKRQSIVHYFRSWNASAPFDTAAMNTMRANGSLPMVSWEPWDNGSTTNNPPYQLADIIAGTYDSFITTWANAAKTWGHPFFLRFAHEMNGNWYPWAEQTNGNSPGQYITMWRHVHDIFTSVGVTNVTWVWCPNDPYSGSTPYSQQYPGDAYVDWTCVDAYAGAFNSRIGTAYNGLLAVAPSKPIMVGEFGMDEATTNKANWMTNTFGNLFPNSYPKIKAVVYFNQYGWVVNSSTASLNAFKAAIASPYYAGNTFGSISTSPISPIGGTTPPPPPPTGGLVASYNFNEGSGTTLTDRSGTGNTGTLSGPTWTTAGKNAGALSFDGTNDWVTVNDSSSLDLTTGMTLEAWVYPTAWAGSGGWETVLIKQTSSDLVYALYANDNQNRPNADMNDGDAIGSGKITRGTSQLPLNTWTHLASTYDGFILRLYVNGAQVSTLAMSGALPNSTNPFRIGGNSVWGEYFNGRIDNVRVYNRSLTASEIVTDMNTPVGGTPPPPPPPPPPPTVNLTPSATAVSLTWSSTNNTSCTASSNPSNTNWTGTKATSGAQGLSVATVGANAFTLSCTGAGGTATKSATYTLSSPTVAP